MRRGESWLWPFLPNSLAAKCLPVVRDEGMQNVAGSAFVGLRRGANNLFFVAPRAVQDSQQDVEEESRARSAESHVNQLDHLGFLLGAVSGRSPPSRTTQPQKANRPGVRKL